MIFESKFTELEPVALPAFSGMRVMMIPLVLGDLESVPAFLSSWGDALARLFSMGGHAGKVGYLTIDEKIVSAKETHRRAGLHVDGVFRGTCGSWGGGGWGSVGNGMITVASHEGCRAWRGKINGQPGRDGECDHLAEQLGQATVFQAGMAYWVDGLCVHESMPMLKPTARQFVRLSMPSTAPWFEGYTENPLGIKPTGPILPRREFM